MCYIQYVNYNMSVYMVACSKALELAVKDNYIHRVKEEMFSFFLLVYLSVC